VDGKGPGTREVPPSTRRFAAVEAKKPKRGDGRVFSGKRVTAVQPNKT